MTSGGGSLRTSRYRLSVGASSRDLPEYEDFTIGGRRDRAAARSGVSAAAQLVVEHDDAAGGVVRGVRGHGLPFR